jgi:hypothetical protein
MSHRPNKATTSPVLALGQKDEPNLTEPPFLTKITITVGVIQIHCPDHR